MDKLDEKLYWLDRNEEGLYESGYLLTKEQLLAETDFTEHELKLLDEGQEVEGAYWGNDTFTVKQLNSLEEVRAALTWEGMTICDTYACVEMSEEYPAFVADRFKLPVCVYECTGYTADHLPKSSDPNPTFLKYCEVLKPEKLAIEATDIDEASAEISQSVHSGDLTVKEYTEILKSYNIELSPEEELRKILWINRAEKTLCYDNRYVNVCLYKEHFTEDDKLKFEKLIAEKGWLHGAMYAQVRHVSEMDFGVHNEYDVLEFDIGKGIASIAAAELSKEFYDDNTDVVVAAANDWDQHYFCVSQNGEPLNGCHVHWVGGNEPEPYEEDGETYYDCDVEVSIPFPFGGYADFRCGGGMCDKDDFEWYKRQMEDNPPFFAYREYGDNGREQEQDDKEMDR